MNPETDLICLEIVKGVPKAPGDTATAETDLETLDLLDANGFSVQPDGWSIALPGIKRGGVWAESQIVDGRSLIAAPKDNVTETITLGIGLQDLRQRYQLYTKFQRLADDAREFWTGNAQIEPVYLKFKANGARVYQYALIYNMTLADTSDPYEIAEAVEVTLVLERETAWRMVVPPGGNPLEYWFYTQGKTRGVDYDWEDLSLVENTDHFVYAETDNAMEFNEPDHTTFLTRSWVDIDGSAIPGDAPALLFTSIDTTNALNQWYMALRTTPRQRYDRFNADYMPQRNILNAGDGSALFLGIAEPLIDSCGVRCRFQQADRYIAEYTKAAGPDAAFTEGVLNWNTSGAMVEPFTLNEMAGNWALFLRCQQLNGAQGDIELRVRMQFGNPVAGALEVTLPPTQAPYQVPIAACVGEFDLAYMGRVTIDAKGKPMARTDGVGYDATSDEVWHIYVDVKNSAAATRDLEFLDLWFMPLDEGFCIFNADSTSIHYVTGANTQHIVDNTGYLLRGHTDGIAVQSQPLASASQRPHLIELLGSAIELKPGVDNRIYMLRRYYEATPQKYSPATPGAVGSNDYVRMNIVPRCYGIADI